MNKMNKKLLAALMISSANFAWAQDTQFKEVTVSADWLGSPTPTAAKKHPGARTVITNAELSQSGARTLEDALRTVEVEYDRPLGKA